MKTTHSFIAAILAAFIGASSFGAEIVEYSFAGAPGDQASTLGTTAANVSSTPVSRGSGVSASAAGGSISSSGWTTSSFDANDYYTFAVTPASDYALDLDTISFAERRSGTGIRGLSIRTSLDSFASDLFSASVPDDTNTRNQSFIFSSSFAAITETIEFRIYGYSSEAGTGTWRLADGPAGGLTLEGDINFTGTVIPEPLTLTAGLLGLGGIMLRRRSVL